MTDLIKDIGDIDTILLLLDWLAPDSVGKDDANILSEKKCVEYCRKRWENDPSTFRIEKEQDVTFSFLMWTPWSRELLRGGRCLPMNALWGVRNFATKGAPQNLIYSGKEKIIKPTITLTGAKRILACHASLHWYLEEIPGVTNLYHPAKGSDWFFRRGPAHRGPDSTGE